jgi:hypothetical protein
MREMNSSLGVVVGASLGLLVTSPALANSLVDNLSPRSIGMGETMRGSAHGGLSVSLNPAGLALSRQLVFEGSYGFRAEDGATTLGVSACDGTVPLPGCFYYQYFSASPEIAGAEASRRVHEAGTLFARQLSDLVFAGINLKYFDYRTNMPGEEESSGFALDVGTIVRAGEHIDVGLAGYNLVAESSAQYPRGLGSGVALRPIPQLSVAIDGVWNLDAEEGEGAGRYGLGAEYFLTAAGGQAGIPLRAGGVYDAGRDGRFLTAGAGYVTRRAGIDAGARYQMSGGDEVILLVSVRLFGPSFQ